MKQYKYKLLETQSRNWKKGEILIFTNHESKQGKGLSYKAGKAKALEDGFIGGWDVFDVENLETGEEFSIYGFSVINHKRG